MLLNPGFERDIKPRDGKPDRWRVTPYAVRSKAAVHGGSFSMRHYSTGNVSYTTHQVVSGITQRPYTFTGWTKIPRTSDMFSYQINIQWMNRWGKVLRVDVVKTYRAKTVGWVMAERSNMMPPANATKARVVMRVRSLNATIYADDFALR